MEITVTKKEFKDTIKDICDDYGFKNETSKVYSFVEKVVDFLKNDTIPSKWYGMGIGSVDVDNEFEWDFFESHRKHWYTANKRLSITWGFTKEGIEVKAMHNWDEHNPIESAFYEGPTHAMKCMATSGKNTDGLTIGEFGWIAKIVFRKTYKFEELETADVIADLKQVKQINKYLAKKETVK